MVLKQTLGIVDLLGAISFVGIAFGTPMPHVQAAAGLALIVKGAMFASDIISMLDIVIGVTLFAMFWFSWPTLALGMGIYLGFKGILSLF